jgi:hypothetical protein
MNSAHRSASQAKRRYQADPHAIFRVLGRVSPFTEDEQSQINLPVFLALDSIAHGKGEEADFHTLAAAVNISMVCAEKIDPLVEKTCTDARDALMRVHARQIKHGTWGFDGPGYLAVKEAADVYQQLTSLLTGGQLKEAMQVCMQRMADGNVLEPQT